MNRSFVCASVNFIICMQAQSLTWLNVILYLNSFEIAEEIIYLFHAKYTQ